MGNMTPNPDHGVTFGALDRSAAIAGHPLTGCLVPMTFRIGVLSSEQAADMAITWDGGDDYPIVHADMLGPCINVTDDPAASRLMWALPSLAEFIAGIHVMIERTGYSIAFTAELDRALMEARAAVQEQD